MGGGIDATGCTALFPDRTGQILWLTTIRIRTLCDYILIRVYSLLTTTVFLSMLRAAGFGSGIRPFIAVPSDGMNLDTLRWYSSYSAYFPELTSSVNHVDAWNRIR